jgi:hypothetical protein
MATLDDAVASGCLALFELPDWEPRLPLRPLYVASEFFDWADDTPELHDMALAIGRRTLFDHLLQAFCEFRCADRIHYGDIRPTMPTRAGVWRLCPPGLRLYGWCPTKNSLAIVTGALQIATKRDKGLNSQKLGEVIRFLQRNKLVDTVTRGDFLAVFPHQNR